MQIIELTWNGSRYAVNADFITAIVPRSARGKEPDGCEVYTVGDNEPYTCQEGYDEVMRLLPESTVPAPVEVQHWLSPWGDDDADDILASDP